MNINYLIDKYGTYVYQNDVLIKWFIDDEDISYLNIKIKKYSSINYKKVLIKNAAGIDDRFKDEFDKEYLVYDIKNIYKNKSLVYSELIVFEDDFDKEIEIYKANKTQELSGIPRLSNLILKTKGRVKEISPNDPLAIPFYPEGTRVTHLITVFYNRLIEDPIQFIIKIEDNNYEIMNIENVNNMNKLLIFYCQKTKNIL